MRLRVAGLSLPSDAADLKAEILQSIREHECQTMVLDMAELKRISTSAFAVLLAIQKRLTTRNGGVRLCCVDPEVEHSLRLCMLHKIIGIHRTMEEAIA